MSGYTKTTTRVPVEPLRRAFEESGLSLSQVCFRLGWTRRSRGRYIHGDTSRLARALGIYGETSHKVRYVNHRIRLERALRIAEAIDLDPHTIEEWLEPIDDEQPAAMNDGRCPECGCADTWTDSWGQQRCEQCWAIVVAKGAVA